MLLDRDYIFSSYTKSFCLKCEKLIDAKIIFQDEKVKILKNCSTHGETMELLEEDKAFHIKKALYDKPSTKPTNDTEIVNGCPFDCGLCPSHDQHSCIGLIEITNQCDLNCAVCYASSGEGKHLDLDVIERMLRYQMEAEEGNAEILQISGGEPTTHHQVLEIIRLAKDIGFKYVMLNTNGLRIAEDEAFAKSLSTFVGGFEIYLQFDGLRDEVYEKLRGMRLVDIKKKAIANLTKYKIPTTLVCTVEKDVNDKHLGEILGYAMDTKYIRGVNFQPIAFFGRARQRNSEERVTLTGVLKRIEKQTSGLIKLNDFVPLPCNVERVAITYLFKGKGGFVPITRDKDFSKYVPFINNTFVFTVEDVLKNTKDSLSSVFMACNCFEVLGLFNKLLPKNFLLKSKQEKMDFVDENTFRISVSSFVDMANFDVKSLQKECVHIITKELKRIPFSAYNMLYRGDPNS